MGEQHVLSRFVLQAVDCVYMKIYAVTSLPVLNLVKHGFQRNKLYYKAGQFVLYMFEETRVQISKYV